MIIISKSLFTLKYNSYFYFLVPNLDTFLISYRKCLSKCSQKGLGVSHDDRNVLHQKDKSLSGVSRILWCVTSVHQQRQVSASPQTAQLTCK